jgi:hypothetical protein
MKSKSKVKNGGCGILISFLLIGGNVTFLRANPEEQVADIDGGAVDCRERRVERVKKILNGTLFEAIDQ